jgi:hypothetical protein
MSAVQDHPLIIAGDSFSAVPGLDVEDDTCDRVIVGGLRKELDLGERYETECDYHERCRRCDAVCDIPSQRSVHIILKALSAEESQPQLIFAE